MPLPPEDVLGIEDTLSRICHTFAQGRPEALAELFTEDGVLESGWSGVMTMRVEGREEIRKWAAHVFSLFPGIRRSRLWTSNLMIDGEGSEARMSCFFNELGTDGQSVSTGIYEDVYRKVDGQWRLAHRRSVNDGTSEERSAKEALGLARARSRGGAGS